MPFSLPLAMRAGRPAISTAVAGIPELIKHGQNGFLCEAPTVVDLQRCLEEAWANLNHLPALGRAAHSAAAERAKEVPALRLAEELQEFAS